MSGAAPPADGSAVDPAPNKFLALRERFTLLTSDKYADERAFLPAALEIIETPASPVGRATALTIVAAAFIAIAWACLSKVDIIVTSQGRIEPLGDSKTVQPLQAGMIKSILVNDNDEVSAGEPLILLDPTDAQADATQASYSLLQARLDRSRLEGLRAAIQNGALPCLINPPAAASSDQLAATQSAMQAQYAGQVAKLASLDQQIAQQQEKNGEALASLSEDKASVGYAQQLANVRDQAMTLGVGDKLDWITANQQLSQQQHQAAVLNMQAVEAIAAAQSLVAQRAQAVADYQTSILQDLVKADQQIDQSQQELAKAQNALTQMILRAPITGTVQELAVHTVGGVVSPAQALLVVVPDNPKLNAEVRIENQDVGFIHVGQTVQLKISAFDFTRYGTIPGVITGLTRDTEGAMPIDTPSPGEVNPTPQANNSNSNALAPAQDARAGSYVAEIALQKTSLVTEQGLTPLLPGMQLTADIKTGRRSVMSYLFSPFAHQIEDAAHER